MLARTRWLDLGWALFTNLFVLAGVLAWGWPPGNVLVLFWVENVILGLVTAVRIATAEGGERPGAPSGSRVAKVAFFVVHYGLFAVVHGVFAGIIAAVIGIQVGFWSLAVPALLIALRYVVDLATTWFIGEQRRTVTPDQAFVTPYPRLFVLHLTTLLGFFLVMSQVGRTPGTGPVGSVLAWLAAHGLPVTTGVLVVTLLLVIKTSADLLVINARPGTVR
jgi:hypothetical protein